MTYDLPSLRATEFPWADSRIWLDHASIGPLPERTRRALEETIGRRCRPYEITAADQFGGLARSRAAIASLIGAEPAEIALATNTSFGLAAAPCARAAVCLLSSGSGGSRCH